MTYPFCFAHQVSGITSVQTSEGHVITVNVTEDGHMIDASQLQALSVLAKTTKTNQIQLPDILAAAAASGINLGAPDDVAHIVAVSNDSGQQTQLDIAHAVQQSVVSANEEQPMETS